jgi:hypothetical protein
MKNHWCSYDATDPILVWELVVPAPAPPPATTVGGPQEQVVDAVLRAGRKSGVLDLVGFTDQRPGRPVVERRQGEWLPYEDALFEGAAVPFVARVFVRDVTGAVVERQSGDAGALLRELEVLDDAYARRFAAAHPFAGAFTTSTQQALTVTICFFCTLFFDEQDPALYRANQPALLQFREALLQIARDHGGTLTAPTTTTPKTNSTTTT